jgi:xanthine/CO dehydrogenase XdhC/CoxF family maturation factor
VAALRYVLRGPAPYIGLLGPRRRAGNMLAELEKTGDAPANEDLARIHGPVGVDIGAETPEEIALSALAEIRAVMAGRKAGFLKHRAGPLHDPLP